MERRFMNLSMKLFAVCFLTSFMFLWENTNGYAVSVRGVTNETIKVGAIFDQTGPIASLGIVVSESLRTYARHINEHGGIHGRKFKILVEDDRYSIPAVIAALKKLVYRDKVFALIGPTSGGHVRVISKSVQKNKMPTIVLPCPEFAVKPHKKYMFITSDTYEGQARALVDYLAKDYNLKERRVGLVYPDNETGKIDLRAALPRLKKYNIEPVTQEILMHGAIDATTQVMNLKRHRANCVLHIGTITATTATLLRELKKFGLEIPVFGSWAAMLGEEINEMGKMADKFYAVHAESPWYGEGTGVERMREITLKYQPGTEKPYRGPVYTHAWVIMTVLTQGLKKASRNFNEEKFINALESLENFDTGGLCNPITYSSTSHKGGDSWKIYKADPVAGRYIAVTGWRKSD
ncbi:MAG: ABC transporter substrate-binding protein [Thermodesulfobacteriota bacterium]|nr:ABC transporter substrate-binding protein [Thermodesulfobacteriota bacterium]